MDEWVASALFWLIVLIPFGVFVRQVRQVRSGAQRKVQATARFLAYSLIPVSLYVSVFLALVAVEELTGLAVIGEGFSRALVIVAGVGLGEVVILTAIFAIAVRFVRRTGNGA